jgi:ATP-dependent helicase/nuclease subunit B
MAAHITHTYGPPGDGFNDVVQKFHESTRRDPFSTWLIVPTKRLARRVETELNGKNIPFLPSRICTVKDFCRSYFNIYRSTTVYFTRAEAGMILLDVLEKNKDRLPLFMSGSRVSSGTLDGLQEFFSVITRRKINFPSCLGDLFGEKTDQIAFIADTYRKKMQDLDGVDDEGIFVWVIDHLVRHDENTFGNVYVYGLFELLPLEEDLLTLIRERSVTFHCSIPTGSDPALFQRTLQWAGDPAARVLSLASDNDAKISAIFCGHASPGIPEHIQAATFSSRTSELTGIASEIWKIHETGVSFSDVSVAFPDVRDSLALIQEVFSDFGIPWTAATKTRLFSFPVVQFLASVLAIPLGDYTREDVIRLVSSPYFARDSVKGSQSLPSPEEIDFISRCAMIENGRLEWINRLDHLHNDIVSGKGNRLTSDISPQTVDAVTRYITQLFQDLKPLEGKRTLEEFLLSYRLVLKTRGLPCLDSPPDESVRTAEEAAAAEFFSILDRLSKTAGHFTERKISAGDLLRILSSMAEESGIDTQYDSHGVSIIGIRECVHQSFPYLFIAGLNEGAMPRLTTRLPFTNTLENQRMGTRSLAAILREERYYFIAALISGSHVFLSAPLSDGEHPFLTSAFFERVRELTPVSGWPKTAEAVHSYSSRYSAILAGEAIAGGRVCESLEYLPDTCQVNEIVSRINIERHFRCGRCDTPYDGVLSADSKICSMLGKRFGQAQVWAPTSLETYAGCPFKFFIEKVIGIEPLPDVERNLSAADRGTVVHDILCLFYRRWKAAGNSKILPSNLADASCLMTEIVLKELEAQHFNSPLWEATCLRMTGSDESGPGLFEQFLSTEVLEADSPLVPSLFEFSFGMKPGNYDDPHSMTEPVELDAGEFGTIRIRGRIDRIDLSDKGVFSITDYKTGSVIPKIADIRSGKALQLPLYLVAYEKISGCTGVAAGYYKIKRPVENKILLCDTAARELYLSAPATLPDFREVLTRSQFFAGEYIRRIQNGEFPLPDADKCPNPFCECDTICRFNPFRVLSDPEVP